jgi:hypothetical protein
MGLFNKNEEEEEVMETMSIEQLDAMATSKGHRGSVYVEFIEALPEPGQAHRWDPSKVSATKMDAWRSGLYQAASGKGLSIFTRSVMVDGQVQLWVGLNQQEEPEQITAYA